MSDSSVWAKLIFNPNIISDPVEIREKRFVIGRGSACSLALSENEDLAPEHCVIERVGKCVFVEALSEKGIAVNAGDIVRKGERKEIFDGSVISLLRTDQDVICTLKMIPTPTGASSSSSAGSQMKRRSEDVEVIELVDEPPKKISRREQSIYAVIEAVCAANVTVKTDPKSDEAGPSSAAAASSSAAAVSSSTSVKGDGSGIADNLVCSICFEIIHDCVSLLPCMHCFCAGCYCEWRERSKLCPECRVKVRRVKKNHVLNNVIDAYLAEHPDRKRPIEELQSLDAKNKIAQEKVNQSKHGSAAAASSDHSSDCDCSECEWDSGSDEEYSTDGDNSTDLSLESSSDDEVIRPPNTGLVPPYIPQCRFCVGFRGFPARNAQQTRPTPNYRPCPPGQAHILCQCCFTNMPDRRAENNPVLPPVSCVVCKRNFCHLYFGCPRAGCIGCLAPFADVKFADVVYNDIINGNQYESNILKNYIAGKKKTWSDVLQECMVKMDRNEFTCTDKVAYNLNSQSPLCQQCSQRNFRDLVYQYRQCIPKDDLPAEVTRRPDCYWGRNCRTQKSKFHHAANFNHICEQTKF